MPSDDPLYDARFSTSLYVSVPVVRLFRPFAIAASLPVITPPFRSVFPFTSIWNPPSPALMPDCSVTLA
ncbi:hypothetical protein LMG28688_07194 [Paraburkholderia caffeinitolerans]|uniref:Uncharacterized protein n=1 Tax=Paraburkholderia caffeinitolerans TaxID=1723730 RepID=A0A6J5H1Q5_9BURK|nr:hypothetical protein LMG28688_07194 [Paraburkholderia caffeinitolerans]